MQNLCLQGQNHRHIPALHSSTLSIIKKASSCHMGTDNQPILYNLRIKRKMVFSAV